MTNLNSNTALLLAFEVNQPALGRPGAVSLRCFAIQTG